MGIDDSTLYRYLHAFEEKGLSGCIGQSLALRRRAVGGPYSMIMEGLYQYGRCLNSLHRWQEGLDTLRKAEAMNAANPNKQITPIFHLCISEALLNMSQTGCAKNCRSCINGR